MKQFNVLLYYYYLEIDDPIYLMELHKEFLSKLNIKGRIIIAKEGINGTVSGPINECNIFKEWLKKILSIKIIDFKEELCKFHLFDKLTVKVKDDIIKMGCNVNPLLKTGIHLSPSEFKDMMKNDNTIILDVRSNMEHKLGKFKNAKTFDINNMYEIPNKCMNDEFFKDPKNKEKNILTYCTGGIKCEKASSFLLDNGFKNVFQLHGGIIKYAKEENGEDFDGKCYVFDKRIGIDVNKVNPKVISFCYNCNIACDNMINCFNTLCNRHTTMCNECFKNLKNCCSKECAESNNKRRLCI